MWSTKNFEKEINKFDPMLRLRESKTRPGIVYVERKAARETKCVPLPKERQKIDDYRRNAEGHVLVMTVDKRTLGHHLLLELRAHDMWEYRGSGYYADALEAQENAEQATQLKADSEHLQRIGEEAYDRAMIRQGDVVSGFNQKEAV